MKNNFRFNNNLVKNNVEEREKVWNLSILEVLELLREGGK